MKHLLLTTIAAVVLVGCGESSSLEADKALLHSGAGKGSIEAAENAIAAGANVNYIDLYGYTPLHVAVNRGDKIMTELLIDNGADLDAKDSKLHAESPLFHALNASHIEITQLLIDRGAGVNVRNNKGLTPLDRVLEWNDSALANLLRKHGGKTGEELKAEGK